MSKFLILDESYLRNPFTFIVEPPLLSQIMAKLEAFLSLMADNIPGGVNAYLVSGNIVLLGSDTADSLLSPKLSSVS